MQFVDVVLNVPINQTFTYSYEALDEKKAQIGKRVEVRFGNRKMTGFIAKVFDSLPENSTVPLEKIRPITKIIDDEPIFTQELFDTAVWVSHYYICSIGEALFSAIPSSAKRESSIPAFSFDGEVNEKKQNLLSQEQQNAVEEITKDSEHFFHYLYGPTGSGKTEVFLQAAQKVLENGKGSIYLVPEISLTPQVVKAVSERFGDTAAVLHSNLTPSQKLKQWKKILNNEAKIVVGPRSAIFAPINNLGLIIIDEEHDSSYKSGDTPRYHARQVAMHRATKLKIPLVMGSATPSVEAYHLMKEKRIIQHTLTKRLAGGQMPKIKCINLSQEKMNGCISSELEDEIRSTIKQKKQTILFLNHRGFTHFFRCATCGYEQKCKNCSTALTYHKEDNRLRCHYCGWSIQPPSSCPSCGSVDVGYSGFGTEYIEEEARKKFPEAKIIRIDRDALKKKGELEEKLDAFKRGEYDILLGTQMVAKGLNFPNLQLVGVILADTGLHLPDFRACERTFALITQVAGRAGRYFPNGKVLVQTYNPEREPIKYACEGNITGFYTNELEMRKILDFPPFSRLIRLVFRSISQQKAYSCAIQASNILKQLLEKETKYNIPQGEVIGPAECPLLKINQNFRYQILLRSNDISILQRATKSLLYNYTHTQSVYIECDIDPVSLL